MARGAGCDQNGGQALARARGGALVDLTVLRPDEVDAIWWEGVARDLGENRYRLWNARETLRKNSQAGKNVDWLEENIAKLEVRRGELREIEKPFLAEWDRRGGWTRAYLCVNTDGHVHRTMSCSTCHPSTQFAFMTELSGKTEDEIIDAIGFQACTVCYPQAPTFESYIRGQKEAEEAEALKASGNCAGSGQHVRYTGRRYERCPVCGESISITSTGKLRTHESAAAKQAKIDADPKKITNPDGTPLRTSRYGTIPSLATAKTELTDTFCGILRGMAPERAEVARQEVELLAAAIAHKLAALAQAKAAETGEPVEASPTAAELLVEHEAKAVKKLKRDRGY